MKAIEFKIDIDIGGLALLGNQIDNPEGDFKFVLIHLRLNCICHVLLGSLEFECW